MSELCATTSYRNWAFITFIYYAFYMYMYLLAVVFVDNYRIAGYFCTLRNLGLHAVYFDLCQILAI